MNILFVTDLYPVKSDEKTTPRTLLAFVEEWKKMGHNVDVLKPNFIFNSFLRGKPFYKSGKYGDVFNINYWTPFWFNVKRKFNIGLGELSQLKDNKYDIVVAHMPSGILFADKLGLPFVAGIHNSDIEVLTNPLYKIHFKSRLEKALKNAKAIACRSFVLHNKLLKLYPEFEEKTFVAPSGIEGNAARQLGSKAARFYSRSDLPIRHETDLDAKRSICQEAKSGIGEDANLLGNYGTKSGAKNNLKKDARQGFSPLSGRVREGIEQIDYPSKSSLIREDLCYNKGTQDNLCNSCDFYKNLKAKIFHFPIKVLTCAHFKKRKNIDKVIKACKGLEGFELTVIGDGKERKSLGKIDKNVNFTGRLPHDEVLVKMRESDVFVLPSVGETFGMVYLEAMVSGCITVCTKGDGVDGIIKNGENGFLTEPNVDAIRATLLNIKNLDENRLRTLRINSFQTVSELTSLKCAEHYLQQILRFCKD